jgi:hypothetical protein
MSDQTKGETGIEATVKLRQSVLIADLRLESRVAISGQVLNNDLQNSTIHRNKSHYL